MAQLTHANHNPLALRLALVLTLQVILTLDPLLNPTPGPDLVGAHMPLTLYLTLPLVLTLSGLTCHPLASSATSYWPTSLGASRGLGFGLGLGQGLGSGFRLCNLCQGQHGAIMSMCLDVVVFQSGAFYVSVSGILEVAVRVRVRIGKWYFGTLGRLSIRQLGSPKMYSSELRARTG